MTPLPSGGLSNISLSRETTRNLVENVISSLVSCHLGLLSPIIFTLGFRSQCKLPLEPWQGVEGVLTRHGALSGWGPGGSPCIKKVPYLFESVVTDTSVCVILFKYGLLMQPYAVMDPMAFLWKFELV